MLSFSTYAETTLTGQEVPEVKPAASDLGRQIKPVAIFRTMPVNAVYRHIKSKGLKIRAYMFDGVEAVFDFSGCHLLVTLDQNWVEKSLHGLL